MKQSQTDKLYQLLKDGQPHRTDEIQAVVYGSEHLGLARAGARVFDVKRKYNVEIKGWHDTDNPALYWYHIIAPKESLFSRTKTYIEKWLKTDPNKIFSQDDLEKVAAQNGYDRAEILDAMQAIKQIYSSIIW